MINITVVGRKEAQHCMFPRNMAVISIYTPGDQPARIEHERRSQVLQLCFDDLSDPKYKNKRIVGGSRDGGYIQLFTAAQALEIKAFVSGMLAAGISRFVVHCDAGVSRSPGVAAALDVVFNNAKNIRRGWECYNRMVYTKVLTAFKGPAVQHD